MYTVIGTTRSRAARVIWMLEELGQPYEHIPARPHSPEILAHSPAGKLPALLVDGAVLTDSTAILTYLADHHQALTFAPGTLGRARQDGLTNQILDEFESLLWTAARHSFVLPDAERVPVIRPSLMAEFSRNQARFAAQMGEGPFLMGKPMTLADILLAHTLLWAQAANFPPLEPRLTEYLDRLTMRPAYTRAMAR